jgi:GNAT superfamily N-acetyltransferase
VQITTATLDDVPALCALGQRFVAETGYSTLVTLDAARIAALATWLVAQGVIYVARRDDGTPVGMIGVTVAPHPMSGQLTGFELFWWVNPESRGAGLRLLRAAEQWVRAQGADQMQVVAPTPQVATVYERLGYEQIEVAYMRRLV